MARPRRSYSRLRAYREKQIKKRLFFTSVVTSAVLAFIILYGFDYFPAWVEFITKVVNPNVEVTNQVKEAPLPPVLEPLPDHLNTPKPQIRGTAMAGTVVKLFLDGSLLGETLVNKEGIFSYQPDEVIADGQHKLTALAVLNGVESQLSQPITFDIDTTKPELVIETPSEGETITIPAGGDKVIEVTGQSESGVKVTVNDRLATVKLDGSFRVKIPVEAGEQELKVVGEDKAGNQTTVQIKVVVR